MSSSDSDPDASSATVAADPLDAEALRSLGLALVGRGDPKTAARALAAAARAAAALGQLPFAVAATKDLERLDRAAATAIVAELAAAYGKGSARVDPKRPPGPPASERPRAVPAAATPAHAVALSEAALADLAPSSLPRVPLFSGLGPAPFARLCALATAYDRSDGDVVVDVGSKGEAFYIIARGSVRITRPTPTMEVVLTHLHTGSFFGEMALLTAAPRTARATCESPTLLLEISRRALDELAESSPEFSSVLADYTRDRLLHNLMLTSGVFAPLDEAARARLAGRFQPVTLAVGDTLLDEGQPGGSLYVIVSGAVDVEKKDGGDTLKVTRLGAGDVVGEISLLTRRPATATVRAFLHTHVLALGRDDFNAIVADFPGVLAHLYQLAIARERDLERFLSDAVVEADDYLI